MNGTPGSSLWDDLLGLQTKQALLAPAAKRTRPDTPTRFTAWSNAQSFTDGGYLARVMRQTCKSCGAQHETVLGVFHVEIHATGARRLQALAHNAQWPLIEGMPLEVEAQTVPYCGACLRLLGFSREVEAPTTRSLVVPHA